MGCGAGFLNVPKIKGTHTAMKSGMTAAEAVENAFRTHGLKPGAEIDDYKTRLEKTWLWDELHKVRNIRPGFRAGLMLGLINAGIDTILSLIHI